MCVICILWDRQLITYREAKKARQEIELSDSVYKDHLEELFKKIEKEENEKD